jgi:tetratricopeptide (TPR) repeat protein
MSDVSEAPPINVARAIGEAVQFHQQGKLAEAERLYAEILRADPNHFDALHLLGTLKLQRGEANEAIELIGAAIKLNGTVAAALSNYGVALNAVDRQVEALESYDRAIAIAPDYAEAHSNRGSTLLDLSRHAEALASCEKALALKPDYVEALNNRGSALLGLNRLEDALASYDRALAIKPDFIKVLANRATTLLRLKRHEEAIETGERILAINPDHAEAHHIRGEAMRGIGRHAEALASYDRARAPRPDHAPTLVGRGHALQALGRFEEALASFNEALALKADNVEALKGRGQALRGLRRYDEALATYGEALALLPNDGDGHVSRGGILSELGHYDEALASYDAALVAAPNLASAHINRGRILVALGRYEDALMNLDRAVALDPDNGEAQAARGQALFRLGRHAEALRCFAKAHDLFPDDAEAQQYGSLASLWMCDFSGGMPQYESYRHAEFPNVEVRDFWQPHWDGEESLLGKTILLHSDDGFSDAIQFVRYVPILSRSGAKVVLAVPPALRSLFARVDGVFATFRNDEPLPDCDYHCSLASLPFLLKTRFDSVPTNIPYLAASPDRVKAWKGRIPDSKGVRVGLAWAGDPRHRDDVHRSIDLHRFAGLLAVPRVQFIGLQRDLRDDDIQILADDTRILHLGEDLHDFDDTAAVMSMLHLVITVDTAVAHLAGAMGKSVWVMLAATPDWRWMLDRIQNPWYPTGRLFRQARPGDWDSTVERVRHELARLVAAAGLGAAG